MDVSDDSDDEEILLLAGMWLLLDDGPSRPNRPRMGREVLPRKPKEDSMWGRHLRKADDRTMVKLLNLNRAAFHKLLAPFSRQFRRYDIHGVKLVRKKIAARARLNRRAMTAEGCLALTLMWLSSTAEPKYLGLLFGINDVRSTKYIRLGMFLLQKVSACCSDRNPRGRRRTGAGRLRARSKNGL
jgi:hypothetical protein